MEPTIITISGEIGWDVMPHEIKRQLDEAGGAAVEIQISSPGGYVYDGLEIFNLIKNYKGKKTARIVGMAASMASYIPLAANKVIAEPNAIYMIHNARAYAGGDQNAHEKVAKILTGLSNLLAQEYIKKTQKPREEIKRLMDAETYYFGTEILDAGFIDEINLPEESDTAAKDDFILDAMLKVESCDKKLRENPEITENFDKIAALMTANDDPSKPGKDPVNHNQNHGENMTFEEFCAKFPEEAKRIQAWLEAEDKEKMKAVTELHEQAIVDAKTEIEAGKISGADAKYIGTILKSENYGETVKNAGVDVFIGENDMKMFKMLVALEDEQNEKFKSLKIKGNQPGQTPGQDHTDDPKAQMKTDAAAIRNKLGVGG